MPDPGECDVKIWAPADKPRVRRTRATHLAQLHLAQLQLAIGRTSKFRYTSCRPLEGIRIYDA